MQNWDDLRFFLAIARTGTVSGAAEKLHVNQSTVSRRINVFEEQLKVRLFERLSVGYKLTADGEALLSSAERIEQETFAIEKELVGANDLLSGTIRVSVPQTLATHLFVSIFAEFKRAYPDIEVQIVASNELHNVSQREVDIALRVSHKTPPDHLIGRELGYVGFGVYGRRDYLSQYYASPTNTPLLWIGEDINDVRPDWLPSDLSPVKLTMRANDALITVDAICEAMGVGRLPHIIARKYSQIVEIKHAAPLPSKTVWLLTHANLRRTRRISLFSDFVAERVRATLAQG